MGANKIVRSERIPSNDTASTKYWEDGDFAYSYDEDEDGKPIIGSEKVFKQVGGKLVQLSTGSGGSSGGENYPNIVNTDSYFNITGSGTGDITINSNYKFTILANYTKTLQIPSSSGWGEDNKYYIPYSGWYSVCGSVYFTNPNHDGFRGLKISNPDGDVLFYDQREATSDGETSIGFSIHGRYAENDILTFNVRQNSGDLHAGYLNISGYFIREV